MTAVFLVVGAILAGMAFWEWYSSLEMDDVGPLFGTFFAFILALPASALLGVGSARIIAGSIARRQTQSDSPPLAVVLPFLFLLGICGIPYAVHAVLVYLQA